MDKEDSSVLIEEIRQQCMKKGLSGIKGLGVLFRGIDHDFSKTLSLNEINKGIWRCKKEDLSSDSECRNNKDCPCGEYCHLRTKKCKRATCNKEAKGGK